MSLLSLPVIGNALLIFVFAIFVYFKYAHSYWERKNVQCPKPSFPFGNVGWVVLQKQSIADKVLRTYGAMKRIGCKYCGLYFFSRAAFIPMDPALIKNILCKDFQHFNDRGIYYDEENDPVSAHLFSLSGVKWKILRTKLTPAFTGGKIKYMFDSIFECADQMISKLNANLRIDDAVEIKEILARFTTDVIGSCAFGIDCNSMTHANAEFRIMGKRAFTQTPGDALKMVIIRSFPKLAKFLGIGCFPPEVSKFFKEVVQKTITYREEQNIIRNDFLQLLIQLKNNGCLEGHNEDEKLLPGSTLSMDEAAAQAFIFFLAGFETTSTAMSFALFELARQEQLQNRSRQEVTMILKKYDEKFCYDAIMEMTYLDTVLLESMRIYPPAPVYLRKCTEDYTIPGTNTVIEKGTSVLIPAIALHRDPDYFPNPEHFNPERFNETNKKLIKDYTYIPFGEGPRVCIGSRFAMVQAKLALALILKHFHFRLNKRTSLPLKMENKGICLNPIDGIWLNLERID